MAGVAAASRRRPCSERLAPSLESQRRLNFLTNRTTRKPARRGGLERMKRNDHRRGRRSRGGISDPRFPAGGATPRNHRPGPWHPVSSQSHTARRPWPRSPDPPPARHGNGNAKAANPAATMPPPCGLPSPPRFRKSGPAESVGIRSTCRPGPPARRRCQCRRDVVLPVVIQASGQGGFPRLPRPAQEHHRASSPSDSISLKVISRREHGRNLTTKWSNFNQKTLPSALCFF